MTFIIKLAGIEGGRGAISVGAPKTKGGRRMLRVRGLSETSPLVSAFHRLREDVITQLDLEGVLTVQSLDDRLLKQRRRKLETTFDAPLIRQSIQQDGATNLRERRIAPPVFDGLTVLFLLRSSPLTPGSRLDVRVLTGLTLYRAELTVVGRERVLVRDRTREAIRIDGVAREIDDQDRPVAKEPLRKFSFWLSADRFHVPLRLEGDTKLGPVEAALLTHTATRAPLLLRPALLLIKNGAAQRRGQSSEAAATSNEGKRSR